MPSLALGDPPSHCTFPSHCAPAQGGPCLPYLCAMPPPPSWEDSFLPLHPAWPFTYMPAGLEDFYHLVCCPFSHSLPHRWWYFTLPAPLTLQACLHMPSLPTLAVFVLFNSHLCLPRRNLWRTILPACPSPACLPHMFCLPAFPFPLPAPLPLFIWEEGWGDWRTWT